MNSIKKPLFKSLFMNSSLIMKTDCFALRPLDAFDCRGVAGTPRPPGLPPYGARRNASYGLRCRTGPCPLTLRSRRSVPRYGVSPWIALRVIRIEKINGILYDLVL